jgi:hypothetical protein
MKKRGRPRGEFVYLRVVYLDGLATQTETDGLSEADPLFGREKGRGNRTAADGGKKTRRRAS